MLFWFFPTSIQVQMGFTADFLLEGPNFPWTCTTIYVTVYSYWSTVHLQIKGMATNNPSWYREFLFFFVDYVPHSWKEFTRET